MSEMSPEPGDVRRTDGAIWVLPGRWVTSGVVFVRPDHIPAPRHGWAVTDSVMGKFARIER